MNNSVELTNDFPNLSRRRVLQETALMSALLTMPGAAVFAQASIARTSPKFKVMATGLGLPEGPVAMADGSVLVCEMLDQRISRVTADGKVSVVAQTGGAPNGAAIGPDGACYVTNNGGMNAERVNGKIQMRLAKPGEQKNGCIQRIDLKSGSVKTLYSQAANRTFGGVNDLVFDASGGFYFTDIGKMSADTMEFGSIYWARTDGSEIRLLDSRLLTPNGIALSPDGRSLYVALTEKRQVIAYNIAAPGQLEMTDAGRPRKRVLASVGEDLGFDSMKVEQNGNIVVGTLQVGRLTVFSPAGEVLEQVSLPDMNVTNLAFGGKDMKTAYVTLTITGQLVALSWPRPGLKLNYQSV